MSWIFVLLWWLHLCLILIQKIFSELFIFISLTSMNYFTSPVLEKTSTYSCIFDAICLFNFNVKHILSQVKTIKGENFLLFMSIWWQKTLTCPICLLYCPFGLAGIKWLISYFPILVWHGITQYWCNRKSWKLDSYWSYDHYWNMVTWFSYVHFFFFSNSFVDASWGLCDPTF